MNVLVISVHTDIHISEVYNCEICLSFKFVQFDVLLFLHSQEKQHICLSLLWKAEILCKKLGWNQTNKQKPSKIMR